MKPSSILREPLMHFLAGGALLFVLYGLVSSEDFAAPDEIVVDDATVNAIVTSFTRTWQRPPDPTELRGLVDNWIREEVLYREGLTMRLNENDPVIRRRVAQKVEFIAEGMIELEPDDAELQQWLAEHAENYRVPDAYSLHQIYFDPDRHGDRLDTVLAEALAGLTSGGTTQFGDPTLLPERFDDTAEDVIGRVVGARFAGALQDLPIGTWSGPVESDFGVHLVLVEQVESGYVPSLEEVRDSVERDVLRALTEESNAAFYAALRDAYTVNVTATMLSSDGRD